MTAATDCAETARVETTMNAASMKTRIELRPVFEINQPTTVFPQNEPTKVPAASSNVGTTGMAPAKTKLIVALLLTIKIMTVTVAVATNGSMPAQSSIGFSIMPPPIPTTAPRAPTVKQTAGLISERRTTNPVASKTQKAEAVMSQYSQEHICTPTTDAEPLPPRRTKLTTSAPQTRSNTDQTLLCDVSLPQLLAAEAGKLASRVSGAALLAEAELSLDEDKARRRMPLNEDRET